MSFEPKVFTDLSDEELCAHSANGTTEAEEELVRRYGRLVRMCARPLFLVGGDSEDLIQEGMLGLLSAIRSYNPIRKRHFQPTQRSAFAANWPPPFRRPRGISIYP